MFKEAENLFNSLKIDPLSLIFAEEKLNERLLNRLKKSKYETDRLLFKIVNLTDNKFILNEDKVPTRADFIEKGEIDRSTLYSFDDPFQLLHADVGNLDFLGKNATFRQYVFLIVDLYSSKVYTYAMRSRKQILQKLNLFHDDVRNKRKGKRMRPQVHNEF